MHTSPARLALVGIHGHGNSHLVRAQHLQRQGLATVAAVADPRPATEGMLVGDCPQFASLDELLAETEVDVVVLSTPIHTHFPLTKLAFEAGADVLLEKPPVTSREEFEELLSLSRSWGRLCQVGFQALTSGAIPLALEIVERGEIGKVTGVSGNGCWVRNLDYWSRAAWAGKRVLNGVDVVDGVVTNPLAHATSAALKLAGATRAADIASVELDLYRANDGIECDDTSVVRVRTAAGLPITVALTLAAADNKEPYVTVQGTTGRIVFFYKLDLLQVHRSGLDEPATLHTGQGHLLDDLLEVRRGEQQDLFSPLADNEGFTLVLDAVRRAPSPRLIAPSAVEWVGTGGAAHPVVRDIENLVSRAGREHRTFSELGVPWS
jgi:predicted dehydrogenase